MPNSKFFSDKEVHKKIRPRTSSVTNLMPDKNFGDPGVQKSKIKKISDNEFADEDMDIWILQCPKNCDNFLKTKFNKIGMKSGKISLDRFGDKKILAVISPEKAEEYKLFCDIKLVS